MRIVLLDAGRPAQCLMNATWAVAKAGDEDGSGLIGGSCAVDPDGRVVAQAQSLGDEVVAECDLDRCRQGKDKMYNFRQHRQPAPRPVRMAA